MAGSFELLSDLDNSRTHSVGLPTGGVTEGEVLTPGGGNVVGFVVATVSESSLTNSLDPDEYALVTRADKVKVNTQGSESASQFDLAYWDGTIVTPESSGGTLIGFFHKDKATADTTAEIFFDGAAAVL